MFCVSDEVSATISCYVPLCVDSGCYPDISLTLGGLLGTMSANLETFLAISRAIPGYLVKRLLTAQMCNVGEPDLRSRVAQGQIDKS